MDKNTTHKPTCITSSGSLSLAFTHLSSYRDIQLVRLNAVPPAAPLSFRQCGKCDPRVMLTANDCSARNGRRSNPEQSRSHFPHLFISGFPVEIISLDSLFYTTWSKRPLFSLLQQLLSSLLFKLRAMSLT
jgi:hypothetical protein